MAKQNPGEKPTTKIMAAATGEVRKGVKVLRTKAPAPAMPGELFPHRRPQWPPKHSSLTAASSEGEDTTATRDAAEAGDTTGGGTPQ